MLHTTCRNDFWDIFLVFSVLQHPIEVRLKNLNLPPKEQLGNLLRPGLQRGEKRSDIFESMYIYFFLPHNVTHIGLYRLVTFDLHLCSHFILFFFKLKIILAVYQSPLPFSIFGDLQWCHLIYFYYHAPCVHSSQLIFQNLDNSLREHTYCLKYCYWHKINTDSENSGTKKKKSIKFYCC